MTGPEQSTGQSAGESVDPQERTTLPAGDADLQGVGPGQLAAHILGVGGGLTAEQVAEASGVSLEHTRRLWRALGFADRGLEAAFSDADVSVLRAVMAGVQRGVIDFETVLSLTRGVGQTMARLADWEVSSLLGRYEELEAQGDSESANAVATYLLDELRQPFEELLVYAWRRHLANVAGRMEAIGAGDADLHATQVTAGFADIVAFTELSNTLDERRIGDLVELFESRCADVISRLGGRVIKSIGDSVLFVTDDAAAAIEIAEGIINVIGRDPRMPDVRVGLATGSVVQRMGDVFGPPVNLAARLTTVARRNRIIIDKETATLLPDDRFETRTLPARPLRGFGIVEPVHVRRR